MSTESTGRVGALAMVVGAETVVRFLGIEPSVASCLVLPSKLSDSAVRAFRDRPANVVQRHPAGGPALSVEIMRHVGSDETLLASTFNWRGMGTDPSEPQLASAWHGPLRHVRMPNLSLRK